MTSPFEVHIGFLAAVFEPTPHSGKLLDVSNLFALDCEPRANRSVSTVSELQR